MTVVRATCRANLVRRLVLAAVITLHQMGKGQLIMSATVQFTSARKFALGQWTHGKTPYLTQVHPEYPGSEEGL